MARAAILPNADFRQGLLESFAVSEEMNQFILEHLDPRAWQAKVPERGTRTIAAIFTHMHNMRRKWVRLSAPHVKLPAELHRGRCTQRHARKAMAESAECCSKLLTQAWEPGGRVAKFHRDGWASPWPVGAGMFTYMVVHDAHHRGQVCMLAHQLGFPLPLKVRYGMWGWERLWKRCGFEGPR